MLSTISSKDDKEKLKNTTETGFDVVKYCYDI